MSSLVSAISRDTSAMVRAGSRIASLASEASGRSGGSYTGDAPTVESNELMRASASGEVDVAEEMLNVIQAQRMMQVHTKVLKSLGEMEQATVDAFSRK